MAQRTCVSAQGGAFWGMIGDAIWGKFASQNGREWAILNKISEMVKSQYLSRI